MKNSKKLLAIIIAAVMICSVSALIACNGGLPTKLLVPEVTISETGVASWKAVEGAVSYGYKINGGEEQKTTATFVTLQDGDSIAVRAISDGKTRLNSNYSEAKTYTQPVVYGLPMPEAGYYMANADVIEENETTRYLVYTTNETAAENYNMIAVRKGEKTENGWLYGEENAAIKGADGKWDNYIGSASMVKGTFKMGETDYNYLIAYSATDDANDKAQQIGLAVAADPMGEWVKVGTSPVIAFDKEQYGATSVGCYAPSVVNYDKQSAIRVFYTYADVYGHFAYMWDADLSDLNNISGQTAMLPTEGNLHSGDAVLMFPNADFVYDEVNKTFYTVKDYSPSASDAKPYFANKIELGVIDEAELYTIEIGKGWESLREYDFIDCETEYERLYSASIVSDAYGHKLAGDMEIVYNVCKTASQNADYLYTQILHTVTYTAE